MTVFHLSIEGRFALGVDEIWPDGDAPADPTPLDVARAMERSGTMRSVLREWGFLDDITIDVTAKGMPMATWSDSGVESEDSSEVLSAARAEWDRGET